MEPLPTEKPLKSYKPLINKLLEEISALNDATCFII